MAGLLRSIEEKLCKACDTLKPLVDFAFANKSEGIRHPYCKECANFRRHNNPAYAEARRRATLKNSYGITLEYYNKLLVEQEGKCKICKTTTPGNARCKNFNVDHDHETGKIRGLLCGPCNLKVGYVEKTPELLEQILLYIKKGK